MAINLGTTYPGKVTPPSAAYPTSSVKNETVPNSSDDGTPLDQAWGNDFEGLKQAVLRAGGISPTAPGNVPETALLSQIMQGIIELAQGRAINYDDIGAADAYELDVRANQQSPAGLFNDQIFGFVAANTNTTVSTIDFETIITGAGIKDLKSKTGNDLIGGEIVAGTYYQVRFNEGSDWVELQTTSIEQTNKIESITGAVAASALTAGLSPTQLDFRNAVLTDGSVNTRIIDPALSLVIPSGATLGTINTIQSRLVLLAIDNAGTVELAVVNLAGGINLDETTLITTVAIDATADLNNVIYSDTARANVPFRVVGFIESTQAIAGTWATNPSTLQGVGGNALTAMSSLGYGQTYQNVTGSRVLGTTYYNTTGKPIVFTVTMNDNGGTPYANAYVDGILIQRTTPTTVGGQQSTAQAIVPPGSSYHSISTAGSSLIAWIELR